MNFPALPADEQIKLRPWMQLADRLGALLVQMSSGRTHGVGIRYYGAAVNAGSDLLASSVVAGVLRPILSGAVTVINARAVAAQRGIEIIESRSSRPRDFANLLSVKLHTSEGERWVEGTVFEPGSARLTAVDGVEIEAPLDGTLLLINNDDQPGVIGEVGTILGRSRRQHRELRARPRRRRRGRRRQHRRAARGRGHRREGDRGDPRDSRGQVRLPGSVLMDEKPLAQPPASAARELQRGGGCGPSSHR